MLPKASVAPFVYAELGSISELLSACTTPEPERVIDFLLDHLGLAPVLAEGLKLLPRHFGPGAGQTLQVVYDPDDGSAELFLVVRSNKPLGESLSGLESFDEEWLMQLAYPYLGVFNVTLG